MYVHADVLSLTVPGSLPPSLSFPPSPSLLPASPPPGSAGHSAVELVEQEMVRGRGVPLLRGTARGEHHWPGVQWHGSDGVQPFDGTPVGGTHRLGHAL